jgi:hypothetical protein
MLQYWFTAYNYILALPRAISNLQHNQYKTMIRHQYTRRSGCKDKNKWFRPTPQIDNHECTLIMNGPNWKSSGRLRRRHMVLGACYFHLDQKTCVAHANILVYQWGKLNCSFVCRANKSRFVTQH